MKISLHKNNIVVFSKKKKKKKSIPRTAPASGRRPPTRIRRAKPTPRTAGRRPRGPRIGPGVAGAALVPRRFELLEAAAHEHEALVQFAGVVVLEALLVVVEREQRAADFARAQLLHRASVVGLPRLFVLRDFLLFQQIHLQVFHLRLILLSVIRCEKTKQV